MRNAPSTRPLRKLRLAPSLLVAAIVGLAAAGCVSVPSGGPVISYTVTQGANGQAEPYLQVVPPSPRPGWTPAEIVEGFLAASASFVGQKQVARDYLTPQASRSWQPGGYADVFTGGPQPLSSTASDPDDKKQDGASVVIGGPVQATLFGKGAYAVAATLPKTSKFRYDLVKYDGQWRISNLHRNPLLLTTTEFAADYQLRNLYFFAPGGGNLVPDPVYVPLQATQGDLVNGLVQDLISQPPDWLETNGATHTAFPKGTSLVGPVTVDGGTASVSLGGAVTRASATVKQQIFSQLSSTLVGAGQGQQEVESIALYIGDKAFVPPGAQIQAKYAPVNNPPGGVFYYLTANGQLMKMAGSSDKPATIATIGTGYTGLAVSPDGQWFAALRGGDVYTGQVGSSKLVLRPVGTGFTSLSWDRNDNLWASNSTGVVILTAGPKPTGSSSLVEVNYDNFDAGACGSDPSDITAVRVAPDGVRIALVFGGQQQELAFGSIVVADETATPQSPPLASVQLSPFVVCGQPGNAFKALSWYGAEDVVTLSEPDDTVTEYPVNGGSSTTIQGRPGMGMTSIAAYYDGTTGGLVAGFDDGTMSTATGTGGVWNQLSYDGQFPVYPG